MSDNLAWERLRLTGCMLLYISRSSQRMLVPKIYLISTGFSLVLKFTDSFFAVQSSSGPLVAGCAHS